MEKKLAIDVTFVAAIALLCLFSTRIMAVEVAVGHVARYDVSKLNKPTRIGFLSCIGRHIALTLDDKESLTLPELMSVSQQVFHIRSMTWDQVHTIQWHPAERVFTYYTAPTAWTLIIDPSRNSALWTTHLKELEADLKDLQPRTIFEFWDEKPRRGDNKK